MSQQVYELNSNGVYGLKNGVYADSLITIIDDFEDADISEYSGDTAAFSTVTSPVQNGSNALKADTGGNNIGMHSTTGLNAYPAQGDRFRAWAQTGTYPASTYINLYYASQSEAANAVNGYFVEIDRPNDAFELYRYDGSFNVLASTAQTFSDTTWYEIEVDWALDGTQTVTLFDSSGTQLAQISATDTTYASGGVGYRVAAGGGSAIINYDHYRIV